jgi:hypothetical protein
MSAEEKRWQAEGDARTLATADAIRSDPKRVKAARSAAKTLVTEAQERAKQEKAEANAMSKIAKKKSAPPKKSNTPRKSAPKRRGRK